MTPESKAPLAPPPDTTPPPVLAAVEAVSTRHQPTPIRVDDPSAERALYFPLVERLPNGLKAMLVHPLIDPAIIDGGLDVCARSFPHELGAVRGMGNTYAEIRANLTRMVVEDKTTSDYGRTIEWTGFFVYLKDDKAVGMSGLYRYMDEPQVFWLGRFGVVPEQLGTGSGKAILQHSVDGAVRLGGTALCAFTENASGNAYVHGFYERNHFVLTDQMFIFRGIEERVYRRELRHSEFVDGN